MKLQQQTCTPCEKGGAPLVESVEDDLFRELYEWELDRRDVHKLIKRFPLSTFMEAIGFVTSVAILAEDERHHPSLRIDYRMVTVELFTHAVKGLSRNDFILAAKIDSLYAVAATPREGVFDSAML